MARIRAFTGLANVPAARLGSLRVGDTLDLVKGDPDMTLEVHTPTSTSRWHGRLVRHGGTLGVRVTDAASRHARVVQPQEQRT